MKYKFLKSTLRFGLGISLLMTLVACPADPEETKETFDPRDYDLVYYPEMRLHNILDDVNNPLNNYTLDDLLSTEEKINGKPRSFLTKLKGPIRSITDKEINLEKARRIGQRVHLFDLQSLYIFNPDGLLIEKKDMAYRLSNESLKNSFFSYDDDTNLVTIVEYDSNGKAIYESSSDITYGNKKLMVSRNIIGLKSGKTLRSLFDDREDTAYYYNTSEKFSFDFIEFHPNGYPKVVDTYLDDSLYLTREFNDQGQIIFRDDYDHRYSYRGGRLSHKESGESFTIWQYDDEGKLIQEIYSNGAEVDSFFFEYDEKSRLTKYTTRRSEDKTSRLKEVGINSNWEYNLVYDDKGFLTEFIKSGRPNDDESYEIEVTAIGNYDRYGNATLFSVTRNGQLMKTIEREIEYYE